MENRKFIRFFITLFFCVFLLYAPNVFAYEVVVHAFLTDQVVDFYNQNFPQNKIDDNLRAYLIDGSRREDDPPRWTNHFYDPVNKRGLIDEGLVSFQSSKEWAEDDSNQNKLRYSPQIATVLSSIQNKKIEKFLPTSDFTWEQALRYWVSGNKEMAMFALGHVIHLLEDASVPDHTRNDPHPGDSPYEHYTSKFTIESPDYNLAGRVWGKKPINLADIGAYFDGIATYSNNNFYSKDSVGVQSGYELPQSQDLRRDGISWFLFASDQDLGEYRLVQEIKPGRFNYAISSRENFSLSDPGKLVMQDYWSHLSTKAVQYSAGAINLFFEEAEKAKNNPEFLKVAPQSFYSQAIGTISGALSGAGDFIGKIITVSRDTANSLFGGDGPSDEHILINEAGVDAPLSQVSSKNPVSKQNQKVSDIANENSTTTAAVSFASHLSVSPQTIKSGSLLTESGSGFSPNAKIFISFNSSRGSISNTEVFSDAEGKFTKTISLSAIAGIYVMSAQEGVGGKKSNEVTLTVSALDRESSTSTSEEILPATAKIANQSAQSCSFANAAAPLHQGAVINEVAWMGTDVSSANEWIELKNISSSEIDISGWHLLDKDAQIDVTFGAKDTRGVVRAKIPVGGFYLLERTDDSSVPGVSADFVYSGGLSDSDEGVRLFDGNCRFIDEAATNLTGTKSWPSGNKETKATMERDSAGFGWHTSSLMNGTPRQENSAAAAIIARGGSSYAQQNQPISSPPASLQNSGKVIVSEIAVAGISTSDEFIELYNPNATPIDLTGWAVKKKSESGTEYSLVATSRLAGKNIPARGYFLLANEEGYKGTAVPDVVWPKSNNIAANNTVILSDAAGVVSDKVGFGSAVDYETNPVAQNPDVGRSISRTSENDTDNNAADFALSGSTPQNSSSRNGFLIPAVINSQDQKVLISEVSVDMVGGDTGEFVELYNPGATDLSFAGWSLQYLSGTETSSSKIAKKNFGQGATIPARGFYLIGMGDYAATTTPDMTWSQSLSNTGGMIFVVKSTNPIADMHDVHISDSVAYGTGEGISSLGKDMALVNIPPEGESLERKALADGGCASPLGEGEFLGNECDMDTGEDFVARAAPHPQNSLNFPEPRVLSSPQNFSIKYVSSTPSLSLSWDAPEELVLNSGITYQIEDASSTSLYSGILTTSTQIMLGEVHRAYAFRVRAIDSEGFRSEVKGASLELVLVEPTVFTLNQFKSDAASTLSEGDATAEDAVVLGATLQSLFPNLLRLEVEYTTGTSFTGVANATSAPVSLESLALVKVQGLPTGEYRWQARAIDTITGAASDWKEFGTSGAIDFMIQKVSFSPVTIFEFPSGNGNFIWAGNNNPFHANSVVSSLGHPLADASSTTFNVRVYLYFGNTTVQNCESSNILLINEFADPDYAQSTGITYHLKIPTSSDAYPNGFNSNIIATSSGAFAMNNYYQFQINNCFTDPYGQAYNKSTGVESSGGDPVYSGGFSDKPPAIKIYTSPM